MENQQLIGVGFRDGEEMSVDEIVATMIPLRSRLLAVTDGDFDALNKDVQRIVGASYVDARIKATVQQWYDDLRAGNADAIIVDGSLPRDM